VERGGGEVEREAAGGEDATFERFEELGDVGVAGVEGGEGVCYADYGFGYWDGQSKRDVSFVEQLF
jgi:hypothetical protein